MTAAAHIYFESNAIIGLIEGKQIDFLSLARLADSKSIGLATSELTYAEVLVGALKGGDTQLLDIYEDLFSDVGPLDVVPVSRPIVREAAGHQAALGNKCVDSIHVATAGSLGCVLFVSADKRLRLPPEMKRVLLEEAQNWVGSI